ncbi:MAG: PAS domain S-box protein, partial [Hyphomicrobium sp.]
MQKQNKNCITSKNCNVAFFSILLWDALKVTINITERKLTEEESKFSEEQFRTLAFGTSQIIWVIGPNGRVSREQSNPSWERFTGQKKEETLDLGMLNAMHPEDRERVKQIWLKAVNSRTTYQAEYRLRRYDGEYRWVAAKGAPIINSDGSVREWFGTSTDITDQKNAEMAARESEIKFQNLWESNWDAQILCFPPEWKLIGGNAAAVKLFGAENTTDLATLTPNDLSPERQPDGELSATKAPKMIEKALRDGASLFEWTHQLRDGQVLTCEVQLTRITVNGQTGVQATVRDVTKRKEAEKKLQDSEERFRTLALSSSHIVWSCGPDGKVGREHFNETWQKFTGANVEDYLGIGWLQWMHPDDHQHLMQKWTHAVETKTPFEDEYRLRR